MGAGSGIGRATAQLLADRGVQVLAADLNVEAVRDLARDEKHVVALGDRAWDATDPQACTRMVEAAAAEAGGVDVVVSTVGWTGVTPFLDETPEYWRRIVDLNLMSAIYLSRRGGPGHARSAAAASCSPRSEAGKVGTTGESVYSAAKAGVIGLAKSLAREFARDGIRVNAVAPGVTETPLLASQGARGPRSRSCARSRCAVSAVRTRSPRPSRSWPRTRPAMSPARRCASAAD